jgi:hypothetical protein
MGKYNRDTGKFYSLGVAVSRVQYSINFEIRNEDIYISISCFCSWFLPKAAMFQTEHPSVLTVLYILT